MSKKESNGYSRKCLVKQIGSWEVYLYKSFDLVHGFGFFVNSYNDNNRMGFGFHKTNKFTAVKQSLKI